jgi:class 3 adenylate cyclase/pimeloyl-ACP methyl ester carboxylesterase
MITRHRAGPAELAERIDDDVRPVTDLDIRFCVTNTGRRIAYSPLGHGPALLFPAWWINNLQVLWEHPSARDFFQGLARHHTVVLYDRQGCGLSDRTQTVYSLESDLQALEAVIDQLKIKRLSIFGFSHGAAAAIAYAVNHPRRVSHLILYGMLNRPLLTGEMGAAMANLIRAHWGIGSRTLADMLLPGADLETVDWFARWQRESATPEVAIQVASIDYDLGDLPERVRVPTLVMHRQEDTLMPFQEGKELAARIPGARFLPLVGYMHPCFLGDVDSILRLVAEFLGDPVQRVDDTSAIAAPAPDGRMLATVLFIDIVGSTERVAAIGDKAWSSLLARHRALVRGEVSRFRGQEEDATGDGFLFTFDAPARAIQCAWAIRVALRALDITIRAGLHTGECEKTESGLSGIAVHVGSRVASLAAPDEILASSTVKAIVTGADIVFEDRGTHKLKGVPDEWQLFAAKPPRVPASRDRDEPAVGQGSNSR